MKHKLTEYSASGFDTNIWHDVSLRWISLQLWFISKYLHNFLHVQFFLSCSIKYCYLFFLSFCLFFVLSLFYTCSNNLLISLWNSAPSIERVNECKQFSPGSFRGQLLKLSHLDYVICHILKLNFFSWSLIKQYLPEVKQIIRTETAKS